MEVKLVASVGIVSCPPAYGWDMGHAASAPSCLPRGVNQAAAPAPGRSRGLSAQDGDAARVCASGPATAHCCLVQPVVHVRFWMRRYF